MVDNEKELHVEDVRMSTPEASLRAFNTKIKKKLVYLTGHGRHDLVLVATHDLH